MCDQLRHYDSRLMTGDDSMMTGDRDGAMKGAARKGYPEATLTR